MINLRRALKRGLGNVLGRLLPRHSMHAIVEEAMRREPEMLYRTIAPHLGRQRTVGTMPMDLPADGNMCFEHLAGLFSSTSFDHAVISLPVRQGAYLFGLVRHMNAQKVIEIGRYKGGSTVLLAAAMGGKGDLWSIDVGEKFVRNNAGTQQRYDDEVRSFLSKNHLAAHLIIGDTRTLELDTGDVDLVFIDGDHSYEGAKIDFERFGRRVRVGGAVLFDDAFDEPLIRSHADTVGRLVDEIVCNGDFRLVKAVNRMAHLERVR
ncbi:MAG: hypothetical protein G01um101425_80 [Candidatus Peregrinibacteria bacterium Gr01-1014_25]|nr:MAG: hypothetical protein G01um101425_80 [Candidatus Peregrinibacteria bacterium Gr01-1014_25]